ncbi:MAG TPA: ABC transporter permease [Terriglobales bacterium]|nr:ABC transporter permease [Terriglobales bacterium]
MNRMWAIVERELRKFLRSPALMLVSMVLPLVQLVILGNAFGGKIRDAKMGVVDQDHGTQAVKLREAFSAVEANIRTFKVIYYDNDVQAKEDVRTGKIQAAVIIPPEYSRKVYEQNHPRIGVVVDNTDNFIAGSLEAEMQSLVDALNNPTVQPRIQQQIALEIVELYPYVEYMKYLLPGSISLAMYISVMIGGGMLYIDDKARGVHEGYLVTPITKFELVAGLNIAGAIKAILAGIIITVLGCLLSGLGTIFLPLNFIYVCLMILVTSLAFNTMMFLMMVRVEDPLVPRATFGILNTLLFFPSGAIYPIKAFPPWLRWIAYIDPFSYSVDGFKALLLKDAGFAAIRADLAYLTLAAAVMITIATMLFKRTL